MKVNEETKSGKGREKDERRKGKKGEGRRKPQFATPLGQVSEIWSGEPFVASL